ncbi:hypothetical protein MKX03_013140 [Papaver bracteatum]|nr:hypothetical protein MKX03_013140 [Papaver bracteatum]
MESANLMIFRKFNLALIVLVHQLHGLDAVDGWKDKVVNKSDRKLPMLVFASDDRATPVRCSNCVNLKPKETHENWIIWCDDGQT